VRPDYTVDRVEMQPDLRWQNASHSHLTPIHRSVIPDTLNR